MPPVPRWVEDWIDDSSHVGEKSTQRCNSTFDGSRFGLLSIRFKDARCHDADRYQRYVVEAYRALLSEVAARGAYPVRFWAFVPGIHDELGAGLDRYMVFNAGRHEAYAPHFCQPCGIARSFPTASAVGIEGETFALHCLAGSEPGLAVENPRQVPAYRYSRRFGPVPPCFSRATLLRGPGNPPVLLVGGTASIVGEESRHERHFQGQVLETLRNLANAVAAAGSTRVPEHGSATELRPYLAAFREVRVYCGVRYRGSVDALIHEHFASLSRVEIVRATLCRPELMIEIEGIACPSSVST